MKFKLELKYLKKKIGYYPKIQINHASNYDNIYWGYKRFTNPIRYFYQKFTKKIYLGDDFESSYFWGDINKDKIKYMRNHCFYGINTHKYDKIMPYKVKKSLTQIIFLVLQMAIQSKYSIT